MRQRRGGERRARRRPAHACWCERWVLHQTSNPRAISTIPIRNTNSPASANQATHGTASARKAPATQSFQVLKSSPELKTPSASSVSRMLPNASCVTSPSATAHVDEIHRHEHRRPLAKLNGRHFEPIATPRQMSPAYANAEKGGDRGHSHPIGRHRHAQHVGPGNPDNADDDDEKVRDFSQQADPFSGPPSTRLCNAPERRRTRIRHCSFPVARWAQRRARTTYPLSCAPGTRPVGKVSGTY